MYHIVYLTTNLINNKIYVGKHSTYNLEDGYLGSGIALNRAIKKYGEVNFKRTVLHFCLTEIQALDIEASIVDTHFIQRVDTYNIALGGGSGWYHVSKQNIGRKHSAETCNKRSIKLKGLKRTKSQCTRISLAQQTRTISLEEHTIRSNKAKANFQHRKDIGNLPMNVGYKLSTEVLEKRSLKVKLISPNNECYTIITQKELMKFCKEHGLTYKVITTWIDKGKISLQKFRFKFELLCNEWEVILLTSV
jgi:hypothetical protein